MSVVRVNKTKNYITMSNYHFKEKDMSLKAKGLLSEMLSLPDNWNYTISGLVSLNRENETSIKSTLEELKRFGYLKITKLMPNETKTGRIEYIYDIFEKKQDIEKQGVENLGVEFQDIENQVQYNIKDKLNNNKLNNNKKGFEKPAIEEIKEYCNSRNNGINAEAFYDFYESKGWYVGKNKMKDWKACIRTWEQRNGKKIESPEWFNKNIDIKETTEEERQEIKEMLERFK